ncbi:DUF2341 domain-containing protein [Fulvivirga sp. M361]|uniref:DUF2341 domain-containing protein n=1 Tax=Fulvivirga sp. M361 TaxID=2594266 RepID=UPI0016244670|nr:DUF2341 domain-containing protein [Fulvivirga sp. M361]
MKKYIYILSLVFTFNFGLQVIAQPCLSGWQYTVPITIDNSGGALLNNYQVEIVLNTRLLILDGKMQIDGDDIRLLDNGGSALPYWIETETFNSNASSIWVKIPSIAANSSGTIYLYYGNPSARLSSSANFVFDFFDDFKDVSVNGTIWAICGTPTTANDQLTLSSGDQLISNSTFPNPHVIELWLNDLPGNLDNGEMLFGQFNGSEGYAMTFQQASPFQSLRLTKFAAGACFSFTEESSILSQSAGETTGVWSFNWPGAGNQQFSWPGGTYSRANTDFTLPLSSSIALGNIDINSNINIRWVRVRQYTSNSPTVSLGSETVSVTNITASNSGVACQGNNVTLSATEVSGATYTWENSGGVVGSTRELVLTNVTPADTDLYTVIVNGLGGCSSAVASTTVTVNATSVTGTITGDAEVCFGDNNGVVTLSGNTGSTFVWESSLTGESPWSILDITTSTLEYTNLILTTYYRVRVSNGSCPSATSNRVKITVDTETDPGVLSGPADVCTGTNSGTLTLSNNIGDVLRWQTSTNGGITWRDVANTTTTLDFNDISTNTLYRVEVQDGVCDPRFTDPFQVEANEIPVADFIVNEVCAGSPLQFQNESFVTSGFIQSYFWEFAPGRNSAVSDPTIVFDASGIFDVTLTVTSNNQCSGSVTIPVTVNKVPQPAFSSTPTCDGEITLFTNESTLGTGSIISYLWNFGDGTSSTSENPQKQYINPGNYMVILEATSDSDCLNTIAQTVTVDPLPVANFDVNDACLGESVLINNTTFFNGSRISYKWDFGNSESSTQINPNFTYSVSGVYQVTLAATSDQGCVDQISKSITVIDFQGVSAGNDQTIEGGASVQLTASGGQSYRWSPGETLTNALIANPIATPTVTTTYTVEGTNFLGCIDRDSVTIFVNENFDVDISNVLTPNGDGANDFWVITNIDVIPDPVVQVFDRNGVEVFSSTTYNNDWEGTRGSDILPDGTYYYVITSESSGAAFKGALTIIRNNGN